MDLLITGGFFFAYILAHRILIFPVSSLKFYLLINQYITFVQKLPNVPPFDSPAFSATQVEGLGRWFKSNFSQMHLGTVHLGTGHLKRWKCVVLLKVVYNSSCGRRRDFLRLANALSA
jgi:hypothetical protein